MKTCNLEVSKKLVEAGIEIKTYFVKINIDQPESHQRTLPSAMYNGLQSPTACELGELLPSVVVGEVAHYTLEMVADADDWYVRYVSANDGETLLQFSVGPMADAMGLMLIWLKENGHLDGKGGD
jgi:hypothetical protein